MTPDPSPPSSPSTAAARGVHAAAALLLVVHATLAWMTRPAALAGGNDDAVYLLLARALRAGHYRELFYLGTPVHSQYPPGYPGFLALVSLPSEGFHWLVAANVAVSTAALFLLFRVLRHFGTIPALAALAVLAVNPSLLDVASRLTSEPLYLLCTVAALAALHAGVRPARSGAAAIGAALTRSIGVTIVGAVLLELLLQRRWRAVAGVAAASALTVGAWIVWSATAPTQFVGRSYFADVTQVVDEDPTAPQAEVAPPSLGDRAGAFARTLAFRLRYNTTQYLTRRLPTELAMPTIGGTIVDNVAWIVVILAAGAAGLWVLWASWRASVLYLAVYAGLLALWPYALGRFLTPVVPFIVVALLLGAGWIAGRFHRRASTPVLVALAVMLAASGVVTSTGLAAARSQCDREQGIDDPRCFDPVTNAWMRALRDIPDRLPADARILTTKEGPFYYYTGRQVMPIYGLFMTDSASVSAELEQGEATHLLLTHLRNNEKLLMRPLLGLCDRLSVVETWSNTVVLLRLAPPPPGEADACETVRAWRETW